MPHGTLGSKTHAIFHAAHARSKAPCKANTRLSRHAHIAIVAAVVVVIVNVVGRHSYYSYGYSYLYSYS
jgi:hypothetical protein